MSKIKIKDWNGIFTNLDENDTRPEVIRDSTNFKFKQGYAEYESRNLGTFTLPDLDTDFPTHNFVWETGKYCTLTNDPNTTEDEEAWKVDILVLVAKELSGSTYNRLVYLYDLTNNLGWYDLCAASAYGTSVGIRLSNHDGAGDFSNSLLSTEKSGKTFFQVERGALKIYMPHDCFKVQWINRRPLMTYLNHGAWYIDRLVEPYDYNAQTVQVDNGAGFQDVEHVPEGTDPTDVRCGSNRRLGIKFEVEGIDDESLNLDERETTMVSPPSSTIWYRRRAPLAIGSYMFLYTFADADTGEQLFMWEGENSEIWSSAWPVDYPNNMMDDGYWWFHQSTDTSYLLFHGGLAGILVPDGTTWGAIATYGNHSARVTSGNSTANGTWKILKSTFEAQTWIYRGTDATIANSGFVTATDKRYSIIATGVLDEREEIIMEVVNGEAYLPSSPTRFGLKIKNIYVPYDINKRLTRIRFYHKVQNIDTDYSLHKEVDLLNGTGDYDSSFYMGEYTDSGLSLSQNIGFLFDWEKPAGYEILTGFKSFTTESGVSIGITTGDTVNLYHSTVGGGNLMADLVYDANRLPVTGISNIQALCNINGKIGAFTDSRLYVIASSEALGQLVFSIDDTMDHGVKNFNDISSIQGGAAINTRNGIFTTDGFNTQLISEPINDIVKSNYNTSSIYYNSHRHELYYKPTAEEDLYRFRFEDKVWEKINATITEAQIEEEEVAID